METHAMSDLQIIIPAAGSSRRLGHPKQDIPYVDQPLWRYVARLAAQIPASRTTLVTGAWQPESSLLKNEHRITAVHCPDWQAGMGASIACGIKQSPLPALGYLILLIDQWGLTAPALNTFVQNWNAESIQVATDHAYRGPPALFPVSYYDQLCALDGDQGAKHLWQQAQAVYCPLPQSSRDLDTEEDRLQMLRTHQTTHRIKEPSS